MLRSAWLDFYGNFYLLREDHKLKWSVEPWYGQALFTLTLFKIMMNLIAALRYGSTFPWMFSRFSSILKVSCGILICTNKITQNISRSSEFRTSIKLSFCLFELISANSTSFYVSGTWCRITITLRSVEKFERKWKLKTWFVQYAWIFLPEMSE